MASAPPPHNPSVDVPPPHNPDVGPPPSYPGFKPEYAGKEYAGPYQAGPYPAGPDPAYSGPYQAGPYPAGPDPTYSGPYQSGPYPAGPNPAYSGPYRPPSQPQPTVMDNPVVEYSPSGTVGEVTDDRAPLLGGFSEKTIRMGFIRKVYGILTAQLAVTIAIMCIFLFSKTVKNYVVGYERFGVYYDGHLWVLYTAMGITFASLVFLICVPGIRKTFPSNIIFLGIFTVCEGVLLGIVASLFAPEEVLAAAGICCVVVLGLTLFAFQTKIDFTGCGAALFVTLLIFICFGFLMIPFHDRATNMIYSGVGALIFCLYLIFDTQLMIGGKHKYAISPEEYVFAALNLYLDVINLFLYILMMVGGGKK